MRPRSTFIMETKWCSNRRRKKTQTHKHIHSVLMLCTLMTVFLATAIKYAPIRIHFHPSHFHAVSLIVHRHSFSSFYIPLFECDCNFFSWTFYEKRCGYGYLVCVCVCVHLFAFRSVQVSCHAIIVQLCDDGLRAILRVIWLLLFIQLAQTLSLFIISIFFCFMLSSLHLRWSYFVTNATDGCFVCVFCFSPSCWSVDNFI